METKSNINLFRGSKAAGRGRGKMKGKGGMVGGKKEMYDLIVNIDLEQWKLSDQQVGYNIRLFYIDNLRGH